MANFETFRLEDFIKHKLLISEECFAKVCSLYYCVFCSSKVLSFSMYCEICKMSILFMAK